MSLPGRVFENIALLWEMADHEERHSILSRFLEAVYDDVWNPESVTVTKPKPQFIEVFQFMNAQQGSPAQPENKSPETDEGSGLALTDCSRRGRDDFPNHGFVWVRFNTWSWCTHPLTAGAWRRVCTSDRWGMMLPPLGGILATC